jgi:hypothetical protein
MKSRAKNRGVLANRPDIIIRNKTDKICLLIDVAIPSDRNVIQKGAENKLEYKISTEIQRMWNMKRFVTPVIIRATGTVTKGLKISGCNTRKECNRFCTKKQLY